MVANDTPALARTHHATVVYGRPLFTIIKEFALVEAAGRLRDLIIVLTVEDVTGAQRWFLRTVRFAHDTGRVRQTRIGYLQLNNSTPNPINHAFIKNVMSIRQKNDIR